MTQVPRELVAHSVPHFAIGVGQGGTGGIAVLAHAEYDARKVTY
jgi:hypothetical protein